MVINLIYEPQKNGRKSKPSDCATLIYSTLIVSILRLDVVRVLWGLSDFVHHLANDKSN